MVLKLCLYFILLTMSWGARGESEALSNVAFVIDDTWSMKPVIDQVKVTVNKMFNTIYSSKTESIGNFILLTFNDYHYYDGGKLITDSTHNPIKLWTVTNNPEEFLTKLRSIQVRGNEDCPELCLSGIKKAIEQCNHNSFIYVFTDASAKDWYLQDTIEDLAQQKSIQITFLLVVDGMCQVDVSVYQKLATATSGEVFQLNKYDIQEVLTYVTHTSQGTKIILSRTPIKPGSNSVNITTDSDMKDVSINVKVKPDAYVDVNVKKEDGSELSTKPLVTTINVKVVLIPNPGNETYVVTVNTNGFGDSSVQAIVSLNFNHGFSTWNPTTLKHTKTTPVPDKKSYLAIKLLLPGTIDAELKSIHILDINDNELMSMSANVVNKTEKLYVTEPFQPPNQIFKIKIVAINRQTNESYSRIRKVPILPRPNPKESPEFDKSNAMNTVNEGSKALLSCRLIQGSPIPKVTWEFKRLNTGDFITLGNTEQELEIDRVKTDNVGVYKCHAKNNFGEDFHEVSLTVQYPPVISKRGKKKTAVKGTEAVIACRIVRALPAATITWEFKRQDATKFVSFPETNPQIHLKSVTEASSGVYKCRAKNSAGEDVHAIEFTVNSAPTVSVDLLTSAKLGDKVTLSCEVNGVPKPNVTWIRNGVTIQADNKYKIFSNHSLRFVASEDDGGNYTCEAQNSVGQEFKNTSVLIYGNVYDIQPDGTLIIYNPDEAVAGRYICIADNNKTSALQPFTVKVKSTLAPSHPAETIYIEEGTSKEILCKLPHGPLDTIRWYKKGLEISSLTKRLELRGFSDLDSDIYSCRISSLRGSQSAHFRIEVGVKPYFEYKRADINIVPYVYGLSSTLDCNVIGNPQPKLTWWHNGNKQSETSEYFTINKIYEEHLGEYRCEAENVLGAVSRTYVLKVTGCKVNYAEKERNKFHPVLLSKSGVIAQFVNKNGIMVVPENETVDILCPNSILKAYCLRNEFIIIDMKMSSEDRHIPYAGLKCNSEVEPTIVQYSLGNKPCSKDPVSRLNQVGYEHKGSFYEVYQICMNSRSPKQYFVKYTVIPQASNIKIGTHPFINTFTTFNFDDMFNCYKQRSIVREGCCFLKRQIVSPQDVTPGVQKATYFNVNTAPHWNFCGEKLNLDEVDRRIRDLAKSIQYKVEVFAGDYHYQELYLEDRHGNRKFVPKYLWKLVHIPQINQALAIVTINVPNLTEEEARKLVFCQNLCDITDWMQNSEWLNVRKGYTFCCDPWEFSDEIGPHFKEIVGNNIILSKNVK